jgi:hypothetical protein
VRGEIYTDCCSKLGLEISKRRSKADTKGNGRSDMESCRS